MVDEEPGWGQAEEKFAEKLVELLCGGRLLIPPSCYQLRHFGELTSRLQDLDHHSNGVKLQA